MPKICTPLTDTAIRNAKPREKTYTLGDGEGMYLEVMPNGTKFWRMAYRQPNGRKNRLTFGKYPVVTLAEARTRRLAARRLLDQGIDPGRAKREEKEASATAAQHTFEAVARAWLAKTRASRATSRQRDVALGAGAIALMLNEWIESKFNLPPHDLPDLGREPGSFTLLLESSTGDEGTPFPTPASANEPEAAAEALRSQWGLGELPVKNMITLLESKGIRVYSLAIDAKEVDAFSMWYGGKPFVFLNTYKSAEHCRFDAAHELGHLVLHRHGQSHGPELEREANAFASAFLMPRKSILSHAPKAATIPALVRHKKYWNVSVAALNYRMHSLGLTTDWTYRTLCIQLGEKGYRKEEPEGSPHEKSIVLEKVFSALREDGISKQSVASELHISPDEINSLTFGLMLNVLRGGKVSDSQTPTKKPSLSLIK
jgi:Zn-dependent peptidase ImmA (M78 family)